MSVRRLIVNADDFGLSAGVNRGVARAHEHGVVTSASLMVRAPFAAEAAAYAAAHPGLSLGLHVELEPWRYAGEPWVGAFAEVPCDDEAAVGAEVAAQVERFEELTGQTPTHLDSHHHLHREQPARSIVLEHAARLGVPVRDCTPGLRYEGRFFARDADGAPAPAAIAPDALCALLRALPPGATELGCHPALGDASGSAYAAERDAEVASLCDPRVRDALAAEGIALRSYRDWDD